MSHQQRRRIPDWLLGLLLAIIVVALLLAFAGELGIGDDPGFLN